MLFISKIKKILTKPVKSKLMLFVRSPANVVFGIASLIAIFGLLAPWSSYRMEKWPTVTPASSEVVFLEGATLEVSAKAYCTADSKKYLKKDVLSRGYQPIQITIQNHSPHSFSISSGSVDLATVESDQVAKMVMYSSIPRAIAFKAASFLFWPFIIPDTMNTIKTWHSHNLLKKDLASKTMKKEVIAPYSIFNRIIFVPMKEFKESFDVTLIDLETLEPRVLHIEDLKVSGPSVTQVVETPSHQEYSFEDSAAADRQAKKEVPLQPLP